MIVLVGDVIFEAFERVNKFFALAFSLTDLQRKVEGVNTDEDPSSWRPYITFVDYLREKASKAPNADGKCLYMFDSSCIYLTSLIWNEMTCLELIFPGEKVGSGIRQQPRSRKAGDVHGKKLFEGDNTTDDEEHLSGSDDGERQGDEDDDTPLQDARRARKARGAGTSKANALHEDFASIPMYNNSLFGSATEEQLPV